MCGTDLAVDKDQISSSSTVISEKITYYPNPVSNHFHADNRYTCGHATCVSSKWAWDNPHTSRCHSMLLYLFRSFKGEEASIDEHKYRAMFRLSGYVATQFKPSVAKTVYEKEENGNAQKEPKWVYIFGSYSFYIRFRDFSGMKN